MSGKSKPKINGRLILRALDDLQEPASAFTVTTYVGALLGVNPYEIKNIIFETLEGGMEYGFVAKHKNLYYIPEVSDVKRFYKRSIYLNSDRKSEENSALSSKSKRSLKSIKIQSI